jgi:hypothetical protein
MIGSATQQYWADTYGGVIELDQATIFNTVQLDGVVFPSKDAPMFLKSLSGSVGFDIDRRQRKNRSGRKKTSTGAKSPQWTMVFEIFCAAQYTAWQAILPQINPHLAANRLKTRKVYHPFLADFEISQGTIHRIDFPQWTEGLKADVTLYFEEVAAPDIDSKVNLKATNDPNVNVVAIDKDFASDDGPPPPPT